MARVCAAREGVHWPARSRTGGRPGLRALRALLLLALVLWGQAARAAPDTTDAGFRRHYQRALSLYQQGRFAAAIPEFEAAFARAPLPRLLFNLGQAHLKLGQASEALSCFSRYQALEPDLSPADRARVEEVMQRARAAQAASATAAPPAQPLPPPVAAPAQPAALPSPAPAALPSPVSVAPLHLNLAPRAAAPPPLHRRGWFWAVVGGVAAAGVATGVAVALTRPTTPRLDDLTNIYALTLPPN